MTGRDREREDGRVVLGRTTLLRHASDQLDAAGAIGREAALDASGVVDRQLALARVIGAAVAAEDQETFEACPIVDHERETTRGVAGLTGIGGLRLGSTLDACTRRTNAARKPLRESNHPTVAEIAGASPRRQSKSTGRATR